MVIRCRDSRAIAVECIHSPRVISTSYPFAGSTYGNVSAVVIVEIASRHSKTKPIVGFGRPFNKIAVLVPHLVARSSKPATVVAIEDLHNAIITDSIQIFIGNANNQRTAPNVADVAGRKTIAKLIISFDNTFDIGAVLMP